MAAAATSAPVFGTFITEDGGVQLKALTTGAGAPVRGAKRVKIAYTGRFESGDTFDSTSGYGVWMDISPGKVVEGFRLGLEAMRTHDRAELRLTPAYGYGAAGTDGIPGDSVLIFTIEVLEVELASAVRADGRPSAEAMEARSDALAAAAAKRAADQAEREARKAAAAARGAALAAKGAGKSKKK